MTESRDEQLERLDQEVSACRVRLARLKMREIELQAEIDDSGRQSSRQEQAAE